MATPKTATVRARWECMDCEGTGVKDDKPCDTCDSKGFLLADVKLSDLGYKLK